MMALLRSCDAIARPPNHAHVFAHKRVGLILIQVKVLFKPESHNLFDVSPTYDWLGSTPTHHSCTSTSRRPMFYVFLPLLAVYIVTVHSNTCLEPVPMSHEMWKSRFEMINKRAKAGSQYRLGLASGNDKIDLIYIGDSIVHRFDSAGKKVWDYYYMDRHAVNMGINGDRIEHVLWRYAFHLKIYFYRPEFDSNFQA